MGNGGVKISSNDKVLFSRLSLDYCFIFCHHFSYLIRIRITKGRPFIQPAFFTKLS